jgi:hypothetical protein
MVSRLRWSADRSSSIPERRLVATDDQHAAALRRRRSGKPVGREPL